MAAELVKVVVVEPIKAGGKWHKPGDEPSLPKPLAEELTAAGLVAAPKKAAKAPAAPPPAPVPPPAPAPAPAVGNGQGDLAGGTQS